MTHSHAGLLLDMGLGKTVVTLTVLHRLLYDEFALNKALVIAPKRVAEDTWSREAEKWDHLSDLRVVKVLGSAKQREAALRQDGDVRHQPGECRVAGRDARQPLAVRRDRD